MLPILVLALALVERGLQVGLFLVPEVGGWDTCRGWLDLWVVRCSGRATTLHLWWEVGLRWRVMAQVVEKGSV